MQEEGEEEEEEEAEGSEFSEGAEEEEEEGGNSSLHQYFLSPFQGEDTSHQAGSRNIVIDIITNMHLIRIFNI